MSRFSRQSSATVAGEPLLTRIWLLGAARTIQGCTLPILLKQQEMPTVPYLGFSAVTPSRYTSRPRLPMYARSVLFKACMKPSLLARGQACYGDRNDTTDVRRAIFERAVPARFSSITMKRSVQAFSEPSIVAVYPGVRAAVKLKL